MKQEEVMKPSIGGLPEQEPHPTADRDAAEEKSVIPFPSSEKPDEVKSMAVVEKITDPSTDKSANTSTEKSANTSSDRDAVLSRIETEKRLSLIRAWEESEKIKAENKAAKKMSIIKAWENAKKAAIESDLKRMEEELEKKKAEYGEKMKNKIAMIHKEGEDKRAMVEAKRGEETLKADEMAAKYRAMGSGPKKLFKCF